MDTAARPRLMIYKLVLENFKSYAGVRTVGPFHKCFSAVVGPNGSGKSNVIDALLFVFGKRAKQLRQAKVSELIHNSDAFPDLQYAKVTVYFHDVIDKEGDNYEVVPDSSLVVSRVAYKNNSSKYYTGDTVSNYTEVTSLLRRRGIDLDHNRFLILQGEVEQIALMKPKAQTQYDVGMLEYLEDIVGSNVFVERIEKAGQQVDSLNEERNAVLNRVKAVEKERDQLAEGKDEALLYYQKEKELFQKQSCLYQHRRAEAEEKASGVLQKKAELEVKWRDEQARIQEAKDRLNTKELEFKKDKSEHERLAKELAKAKNDWAVYERNDIQFRHDIKHLKGKIKSLSAQIEKDKAKIQEKNKLLKNHRRILEESQSKVEKLQNQLPAEEEKLEAIYESLKGETADLHKSMEEKQKRLLPYQKKLLQAQSNVDLVLSEQAIIRKRVNEASQTLEEAHSKLKEIEAGEMQSVEASQESSQALKEAKKKLASIDKELIEAKQEEAILVKEIRHLQTIIEQGKAAINDVAARSHLLTRLMTSAASGELKGVYGRLGDLGTIDDKYNVAVSTACPALDHIVVDTTESGQQCVAYLRKERLGVASFIMLDKMGHLSQDIEAPFTSPEGVPRLFDLITPAHARFLPAFYFALRNTLVCKDLEQATRIAYGATRHRVVTLQGHLIDTSGTMSGGGTTPIANKMNTSSMRQAGGEVVSKEELHRKQKELESASGRLASLRSEIVSMEKARQEALRTVEELPIKLRKLEMDIEALRKLRPDIENRIAVSKKAAKLSKEEENLLASLDEQIAAQQKIISDTKRQAAELEAEVAALQEEIAQAGGEPLRLQKERVAAITAQVDELEHVTTKTQVQIASTQKGIAKTEKGLEAAAKELNEGKEELATLENKFSTMEDEATSVMELYNSTKKVFEEKEAEMRSIAATYEELREAVRSLRSGEVDIENQLADISKVLMVHQKKAQSWASQITEVNNKYARIVAEEEMDCDSEEIAGLQGKDTVNGSQKDRITAEESEDEDGNDNADEEEEEEEEEEETDRKKGEAEKAARRNKKSTGRTVNQGREKGKGKGKLPVLSEEEMKKMDPKTLECDIGLLETELSKMKPNLSAIQAYRQKHKDFLIRVAQLDSITAERDRERGEYDALRKQRLEMFMDGFSQITLKLKEMYQMITIGGDAELELVDSLDPFSEGVVFSVRPPKKSWKNISNLSGGEKTLSSLALVFALHHYKPTPIYIMDEIDAALDFKNVSIIANYIKERTQNAQFIIVSLRNNMFEMANRMVGIYKTNNCTNSVTINPNAFRLGITGQKQTVQLQNQAEKENTRNN